MKKDVLYLEHLSQYLYVQSIAKSTMIELKNVIKEGISEYDIRVKAEDFMREKGVNRFWYHGIGAFVHVGRRIKTRKGSIHWGTYKEGDIAR